MKCAKCLVRMRETVNDDGDQVFTCPACGSTLTFPAAGKERLEGNRKLAEAVLANVRDAENPE